jgi:putative endonuclease
MCLMMAPLPLVYVIASTLRHSILTAKTEWFVYIIEADNGHLYTGITTDLSRRFKQHQAHSGGARFFHTSPARKLVYQETQPDRSSASKREIAIKKLRRSQKLALIQSQSTTDG